MPDGLPDVTPELIDSIGSAVEGVEPVAPAEPSNPEPEATPATPEGEATEAAATEASDSFSKLDPNALPEELRPYYQSMQSDYTRKTQEAAPWRKLAEELGVESPDSFREAAELYTALQDPTNLKQLYNELGGLFGQEATPATEPPVPVEQQSFEGLDDPAVAQLRQEMASLREDLATRDAQQQTEALQWELLGELNRQEALVKDAHPDWAEEEWNALWNLSVAFNGDLIQAADHVEAAQNAALTRTLNAKAQAASTEGLVTIAPSRDGVVVEEQGYVDDPELRGPTARAMEYLKQVVNGSE